MTNAVTAAGPNPNWLKTYYILRAAVSALWVALALTIGRSQPGIATGLLVAYPLWDCFANYLDAKRSGGLGANPTQSINVVVSAVVALAIVIASALTRDFHAIMAVIGVWATLSGILQLSTAIRRWRSAGAQWPMILSGAQSTLAGVFFVKLAADASTNPDIAAVANYAAIGAVYFAISAGVLAFSARK